MENLTITLLPENDTFKQKKSLVVSQPITLGRLLDGQDPNKVPANWLRFNSKVVSRSHARITHAEGKFFIQDTKSSSGTFVNGERLSQQGIESPLKELHDGDIIKLGEDFNQDGVLHLSVMFKVKLPGGKPEEDDTRFDASDATEVSIDFDGKASMEANIDEEFNTIWNALVADINMPLNKLRNSATPVTPSTISATSASASANNTVNSFSNSLMQTSSTQSSSAPSPQSLRNDNTVTLIRPQNVGNFNNIKLSDTRFTVPENGVLGDVRSSTYRPESKTVGQLTSPSSSVTMVSPQQPQNQNLISDCVQFIESLQWESIELRETLVDLVRKQDQQLLAFYKSLRGFPSSFINVASKYAKYSVKKK